MSTSNNHMFNVPDYFESERGHLHLLIDPETPNWIVTDKRGSGIVKNIKK